MKGTIRVEGTVCLRFNTGWLATGNFSIASGHIRKHVLVLPSRDLTEDGRKKCNSQSQLGFVLKGKFCMR